jgi:hypothetical protein
MVRSLRKVDESTDKKHWTGICSEAAEQDRSEPGKGPPWK